MNDKEIQVIDFAYLRMCAEHNYIYETGEAKLLLNYITNLQQENARLKDKNKKALELLQILHYNFSDYDDMHKKIEDIEEILKEN